MQRKNPFLASNSSAYAGMLEWHLKSYGIARWYLSFHMQDDAIWNNGVADSKKSSRELAPAFDAPALCRR